MTWKEELLGQLKARNSHEIVHSELFEVNSNYFSENLRLNIAINELKSNLNSVQVSDNISLRSIRKSFILFVIFFSSIYPAFAILPVRL